MKKRLSITKSQRQIGSVAELISICQEITEDGKISDDEVLSLKNWLSENQDLDIPSAGFLHQTIENILVDGQISEAERKELYQTIEGILPPDIRGIVHQRKKAVEKEQAQLERAQRQEREDINKEIKRQERERNWSIGHWNFMVAGVRYEGRPEIIEIYAEEDAEVFLERDRLNKFSKNAIKVLLENGKSIGFVPEDFAEEMAPLLDRGCPFEARITKILTEGKSPIPIVDVHIYQENSTRSNLTREQNVQQKLKPAAGCASLVILALLFIVIALTAFIP